MDFTRLEDDSVFLCPSSVKGFLIRERSKACPEKRIKFMDKTELMQGVYFRYDDQAVYEATFLGRGYSLDNADELIRNALLMPSDPKKRAGISLTEKMEQVCLVKDALMEKGLLKTNPYFKRLFSGKKVYVFGYSERDREIVQALSAIGVVPEYLKEETAVRTHQIHVFEGMDQELTYVFNEIFRLLEDGVELNQIYLFRPQSDYLLSLKKYSDLFGLPLELEETRRLFDSPIYQLYLQYLETDTIEEAFVKLNEKNKVDTFDALGKLANCINRVSFASGDKKEFIRLLNFVAKKTNLRQIRFDNSIKICDEYFFPTEKDHVFALGFSLGAYPFVARDTDFYSDKEKEILSLTDSKTQTVINKESLVGFLNRVPNLVLTRMRKYGRVEYYDSLLKMELGYSEISDEVTDECFSLKYAEMLVGKDYDLHRLYNIDTRHIDTFKKEDLKYQSYDHHYKTLENYELDLRHEFSYSQISEYNRCPYFYFLKRILRLKTFDENFFMKLGNLFHKVLEDSLTNPDVRPEDYQKDVEEKFSTEKEKFFVEMLFPQVFDVVKLNNRLHQTTKFNKIEGEQVVIVTMKGDIQVQGKIDKMMIDENNKNIVVIDYKTGNTTFNAMDANYGLSMQLPLYTALLSHAYPDYKIAGVYLQKICEDKNEVDEGDRYQLRGQTLNDTEVIKRFDTGLGTRRDADGKYLGSEFISKVNLKKDGNLAKPGTVEPSQFQEQIKKAELNLKIAVDKIRKGEFPIRPISDFNFKVCDYCPCKAICLKKNEDQISKKQYYEMMEKEQAEEMRLEMPEEEKESAL